MWVNNREGEPGPIEPIDWGRVVPAVLLIIILTMTLR